MRKKVFMVAGLGYGDEGKGSTVDYLTYRYGPRTIVRFNGGPQTAHHVVTPEGLMHCFSQLGSGTLVPGVNTYLSRFMLVNPLSLEREAMELTQKGVGDSLERITIDRDCVIVTPFHEIVNQMLEISRGNNKHGSCGKGVGQAMEDWQSFKHHVLLAGDLVDKPATLYKLRNLLDIKVDLAEQLVDLDSDNKGLLERQARLKRNGYADQIAEAYCGFFQKNNIKLGDDRVLSEIIEQDGITIFEGAQGVLLDPRFGFVPHVTKTKTTFENAEEILHDIDYDGEIIKIGVMRAYSTRHGAGPFVTEDPELTAFIPDKHNEENEWQGNFRIGWFDLVATRYGLDIIGKIDSMALTSLDRIINLPHIRVCTHYVTDRGEKISKIEEDPGVLPSRQMALTKILSGCQPVYKELTGLTQKSYISFLEKELGVRISIVSNGPTHKDKVQILSPR